jgi:hypothetical protein
MIDYQSRSTRTKLTTAPGGQTNHNFGVAWDVGMFQSGQYVDDYPVYAQVASTGEQLGSLPARAALSGCT